MWNNTTKLEDGPHILFFFNFLFFTKVLGSSRLEQVPLGSPSQSSESTGAVAPAHARLLNMGNTAHPETYLSRQRTG